MHLLLFLLLLLALLLVVFAVVFSSEVPRLPQQSLLLPLLTLLPLPLAEELGAHQVHAN